MAPVQETPARRLKEKLIQNCIQTWRSRAIPMTALEALTRRFRSGDEKNLPGQLVVDSNPKGYLFIPYDNSPPDDPELLRAREELKTAITTRSFIPVNALLDEEINRCSLLSFDATDIMSPRPLSSLKTFEKIQLVASRRLTMNFLGIEIPEQKTEPTPKPMPKPVPKNHVKVYLLRARGDEKLEMRDFLLSHRDGMGIFYGLLEQASNPYGSGNGALSCSAEALDIMSGPQRTISEAEREEMRREARMEAEFIEDMPRNWSYRLVDSADVARPRVFVGSGWEPVDTEDQYREMLGLVEGSDRSLMVTRTSRIPEAERISKLERSSGDAPEEPSLGNVPGQESSSLPEVGDLPSSLLDTTGGASGEE